MNEKTCAIGDPTEHLSDGQTDSVLQNSNTISQLSSLLNDSLAGRACKPCPLSAEVQAVFQ